MFVYLVIGAVALLLLLAWGFWFDRKHDPRGVPEQLSQGMADAESQAQAEAMLRRRINGASGPGGFGGV